MKRALEKQLQLLSESSEKKDCSKHEDLVSLTAAMCSLVETITRLYPYSE